MAAIRAAQAISKAAGLPASSQVPPQAAGGPPTDKALPPGLKKKKKLPPPWQGGTFNPQGIK